ncbi:MAG TPA: hypothetical protein VIU38_03605 [Anaerolineales bacterium]
MSLITFFAAPKPLVDERISTIQMNAFRSWAALPEVDVILMGDEVGVSEAASQVGARHITDVRRNSRGTPLISSMIQFAREYSTSPLLCVINADMIIMRDMVEASRQVRELASRFVMLSRRWDLEMNGPLHLQAGWEAELQARVRAEGRLHRPAGSDFFVFPRDIYHSVPEFAVGRAGWDNWMIYSARRSRWPVIDCTPSVMAVHQNHDYSHLPGGAPHYAMPESDENIRLAGGTASIRYTILDSTHVLSDGRLRRPKISGPRIARGVEVTLRTALFFLPATVTEELVRPRRWKKRFLRAIGRRQGKEDN